MLNSNIIQDTPSIKSSEKLSEIDNQSLPPTDKDQDTEMGELSESEVRSISLSVDKENYDNLNSALEQDKEDIQDAPYKIYQTAKNKFKKIQRSNMEIQPQRQDREGFKQPENKRQQLKKEKFYQGLTQRTQKKECIDKPLTIQEGNVLIESWKENHFVDFNSWVQVARCEMIIDYRENQSLESEKRPDGYSCSIRIKFNKNKHGELNDFVGNGFGRSKKGAKLQAQERLITDLVQTGLIRLGLRDKKFWYKYLQKQRDEKSKEQAIKNAAPSAQAIQKEKENQALQESKVKIAKKAQHKMQTLLRDNKFADALDQLEVISRNKTVEWKELNFIWSYAMKEQNLVFIKQIINKLAFNRYKKGGLQKETEDEDNMSSAQYVRKHHSDKVKQKLFQFYGLTRQPSENQYEYYDSYVLDINDPDIRPQQIQAIPEDEQEKQIVTDPFQRSMKDTLVNPPSNEMTFDESPMKEIDQKNLHFPGVQIRDPFQSMQDSKKREERNQKSQQEKIYENIAQIVTEPECLRDIQDMQSEKVITQGEDDFVVYRKQPDSRAQFVQRDLVDELYETLIYSGDLNFSLNISELIYSELVIRESEFLHQHASEFYMQKKNCLITNLLDKIYDVFSYNRPRGPQEYLVTLNGTLQKLGCCHSYDSLLMTPQETKEALESKLLKKCKVDVRDTQHKVIEGDVVVLTTFFQPSYDKPILKEQTSRLANYINTKAKNTREQSHFIHSITEFGNTVEYAFIATIKEITVDSKIRMCLPINEKVQEAFLQKDDRVWKITKLAPRFDSNKIDEALIEFCTNPKAINNTLFHVLLTPPTQSSDLIRKFSETNDGDNLDYFKHKTSLNNAQAKAVKTAATQMLTLIQGPPGSGKTTCCIEIVIEWLRQSGKPVLMTAENDQNVDVLFNELMKANIKAVKLAPGFEEVAETHFQAQRQRTSEKIQQKKQRLELQQEVFEDEIKNLDNEKYDEDIIVEQQEHYKQRDFMLKRMEEENGKIQSTPNNQKFMFLKRLLREAPVVVCKASSVGSDYLKGLTFFRVIVDEAHRVSESLALCAVVKNCQKLVLIGDPMSPGVKVTSMFSASKGNYLSLFDKFVMQRVQPIVLTEQYKLHPSLISFPSFYFYKNKIGSQLPEEEEEKNQSNDSNSSNNNFGFKWPDLTVKNAFVYVKGTESLVNNGIQNLKEIEVVIEIMMQMLQGQFIKTNQILILTATEEQKRRFRNEITYQAKRFSQLFGLTIDEIYRINKHSLLIDVDTLDRAQFYDKDLVIFSPVRTNKHEGLGILRDPRILNSLLWCGRKGLITVGDLETLQQDTNWAEYIRWCKRNKLIQYYVSK